MEGKCLENLCLFIEIAFLLYLIVVFWVGVVNLQVLLDTPCVMLVLMRRKILVSKTSIRPKLDAATGLWLTIGSDEEIEVWREVVL